MTVFQSGWPMVLVQKWSFFQLFFFRQYTPGKWVLRYSRTKNAFLGYKNKKFIISKNWPFSKGVNPWFLSKNGHFSNFFFFGNLGQENVFYDILERKNVFLGYKKKKFKKSKNAHFSKRVNRWFWSKNARLSNFFFRQYLQGKFLLWYSTTIKRLCRLWKEEVQKVKKFTFFQRYWPMVFVQKWPFFKLFLF